MKKYKGLRDLLRKLQEKQTAACDSCWRNDNEEWNFGKMDDRKLYELAFEAGMHFAARVACEPQPQAAEAEK